MSTDFYGGFALRNIILFMQVFNIVNLLHFKIFLQHFHFISRYFSRQCSRIKDQQKTETSKESLNSYTSPLYLGVANLCYPSPLYLGVANLCYTSLLHLGVANFRYTSLLYPDS